MGSTTKVRALLDSASSTSFITESLAQRLNLWRRRHSMKVSGIDGSATRLSSHRMVDLSIVNDHEKTLAVEAVVLSEVTTNLPSRPVPFSRKWKHLSNIRLVDPDFGTPGSVDLLVSADIFSRTMLHNQWFGPLGSPSAFKTCFGWVLVGDTNTSSHSNWLNRYALSFACIVVIVLKAVWLWPAVCWGHFEFWKTSGQLPGVNIHFRLRLSVSPEHG